MMLRSLYALGLLAMIGCSGAEQVEKTPAAQESVASLQAGSAEATTANVAGDTGNLPPMPVPEGRKIIFQAHLSVDVLDFAIAAREVDRQIVEHGGFVTASQRGGQSGSTRSGNWTLRVPVAQYRALVESLTHLGELRDQRETSQEVTEEFYDLEARIQNKQQEEERLLVHLNETARNLQEILTIETELGRVREEIERMQGRLRLLADQTALSTIDLSMQEIETFVPAETPTFATRVNRAWRGSLESLTRVFQQATIALVAFSPWLAVLLVVGLGPALWLRRRMTRLGVK